MSEAKSEFEMNQFRQDKREYLLMIQNTISRMSTNSFLTRGWSITIFTGLYTLYATNQNGILLGIIAVMIIFFWLMDSFYLGLERAYRDLYDDACNPSNISVSFRMSAQVNGRWLNAMLSHIFLISYVPALCITVIFLIIKFFKLF